MSKAKRFYWLKLKEDFFDDDTIRYIEEQENGIKYSNFYLKLCLKSLRTDGRLIRLVGEILIPHDAKSLSALTNVDVDTVRCAMALFQEIGCVKMLESGEVFISQLSEMVGSETDKAKMMRANRAREKKEGNDVTKMLPDRYPEIEKEKDIELDKEGEREKPAPAGAESENRKKHGEYGWVLLTDEEYDSLVSAHGRDEVHRAIQYIDESAQSTKNKNGWSDWFAVLKRCIRDGWGKSTTKATQAAQQNYQTSQKRVQDQKDWLDKFLEEEGYQSEGDSVQSQAN